MEEEVIELDQSRQILGLFEDIQAISTQAVISDMVTLDYPKEGKFRGNDICFYRISQLSFDEDYPRREAFESVLMALDNEAFNFIYVLTGTGQGVDLCIGVVKNQNDNRPVLGKQLSAANYGEIISNVFEGNFSGSRLEKLRESELESLIGPMVKEKYKNAGMIVGIPSVAETEPGSGYDFQGIDRLINSMLGLEWRMAVVCEPVGKREILEYREDIYELYNRLSVYAKRTMQQSVSDGKTVSFGKNVSETKGKNWGANKSDSQSYGQQSERKNSSKQHQEGYSEGGSSSKSSGANKGFTVNRGTSHAVTVEIANKHAEEIMRYINEELLGRLKLGYSKGLFKSSVYYMAKEPTHASRLKSGIMSLFQGNKSSYSPLSAQDIDLKKGRNAEALRTFQNRYINGSLFSGDALMLMGRPFSKNHVGLNTYLTTEEVSLLAGLPQQEVPGLSLKEGVGFGLNEKEAVKEDSIYLGNMVKRGRELTGIPFRVPKKSLAKHTFIAGVTGSGKTTTCHRLLKEADMPFLVIEPAKTEYRALLKDDKDLAVFTLGNETVAPFRLNPFELMEGEVISAHVDMIKAAFTSAFPMEASMPQILEEAIYRCYTKKGWDIDNNRRKNEGEDDFPRLSDLLSEMEDVVKEKHFSPQMEADYRGSLVSRLSNLTVGPKGKMLDCKKSTDFSSLVNKNVVLEMEELKSPEDKALVMGFILSRLSAAIKAEYRKDREYRHLTLVEEAHRLLSKVGYGDSGSKKAAVEAFADLLAEVRKYGEGLIIVDQIPNKLASEVLKNTNTKIIHKILAKDDKEAVGDTMLMDARQKEYLSALEVGQAIVFSENTDKPVHVRVLAASDTSGEMVGDGVVKKRFEGCKEGQEILFEKGLEQVYGTFNSVADCLSNMKSVEKEKSARLKSSVEGFAEKHRKGQRQVWEKLIEKREEEKGKAMANPEDKKRCIKDVADFFEHVFFQEDFSEDYSIDTLKGGQYEKPIYVYLK